MREAVEQAYIELNGVGLALPLRSVREKLGDTSSLTTIAGRSRAIELERQEGTGPALPSPEDGQGGGGPGRTSCRALFALRRP